MLLFVRFGADSAGQQSNLNGPLWCFGLAGEGPPGTTGCGRLLHRSMAAAWGLRDEWDPYCPLSRWGVPSFGTPAALGVEASGVDYGRRRAMPRPP